jgi:hypothetical protein
MERCYYLSLCPAVPAFAQTTSEPGYFENTRVLKEIFEEGR